MNFTLEESKTLLEGLELLLDGPHSTNAERHDAEVKHQTELWRALKRSIKAKEVREHRLEREEREWKARRRLCAQR